jgi:tetratricopeptide (TPR) repeat protein
MIVIGRIRRTFVRTVERVRRLTGASVRVAFLLIGMALFSTGMLAAGRAGLGRLLAAYGVASASSWAVELAVRVNAADPETHYARANLLASAADFEEASRELETAIALRPQDYFLWLALGDLRERASDADGARLVFARAKECAPYYAQPYWQMGNLLLRRGEREQAFVEIAGAIKRDPQLLDISLYLAWNAYAGDAEAVARALRLDALDGSAALAFARFLIERGQPAEAVAFFGTARGAHDERKRQELLRALIHAGYFAEAVRLRPEAKSGREEMPFMNDEESSDPFGWELVRGSERARAILDQPAGRAGSGALRLEFNGESDPDMALAMRTLLVQPETAARLRFAARVEDVVTGGTPIVVVTDAATGRTLAASDPISDDGWRDHALTFNIPAGTHAVRIIVRRQRCAQMPCPAFGRVWLDSFSLVSHASGM